MTISARDLKPGCSYTTKKGDEVIYMGRFLWFTWDQYGAARTSRRKHIFAHPKKPEWEWENQFFPKNDASFLAELNSEDPVQNYAALVDKFNGDIHSSEIKEWKTKPLKPTSSVFRSGGRGDDNPHGWSSQLRRSVYTSMADGNVLFWRLAVAHDRLDNHKIRGYRLVHFGTLDTKQLKYSRRNHDSTYYYDSDCRGTVLSEQETLSQLAGFVEVDAVLSSGKKLRVKDIDSVAVK